MGIEFFAKALPFHLGVLIAELMRPRHQTESTLRVTCDIYGHGCPRGCSIAPASSFQILADGAQTQLHFVAFKVGDRHEASLSHRWEWVRASNSFEHQSGNIRATWSAVKFAQGQAKLCSSFFATLLKKSTNLPKSWKTGAIARPAGLSHLVPAFSTSQRLCRNPSYKHTPALMDKLRLSTPSPGIGIENAFRDCQEFWSRPSASFPKTRQQEIRRSSSQSSRLASTRAHCREICRASQNSWSSCAVQIAHESEKRAPRLDRITLGLKTSQIGSVRMTAPPQASAVRRQAPMFPWLLGAIQGQDQWCRPQLQCIEGLVGRHCNCNRFSCTLTVAQFLRNAITHLDLLNGRCKGAQLINVSLEARRHGILRPRRK